MQPKMYEAKSDIALPNENATRIIASNLEQEKVRRKLSVSKNGFGVSMIAGLGVSRRYQIRVL